MKPLVTEPRSAVRKPERDAGLGEIHVSNRCSVAILAKGTANGYREINADRVSEADFAALVDAKVPPGRSASLN
jgi:hypothetical protein